MIGSICGLSFAAVVFGVRQFVGIASVATGLPFP
jgi:hypothetical protein